MSAATASKLDTDRFRKVHRLMTGGATPGERKAATARAEAMAARAGMTLKDAVSSLDGQPKPQPKGFFDGFDDWCEAREPGYKAKEARKKAEQNARDAARRAEVLAQYGSEKALLDRTPQEAALDAAIAHMATWTHWTNDDGTEYRVAKTLDGREPDCWGLKEITPAIREAVTTAYPWPSTLDAVLSEVKGWDRLRWDRGLLTGNDYVRGEWEHYPEVECRYLLLEDELECGRPAASWDDVQARFDWKRYEFERQWIYPTERDDPFLDRLEADVAELRATNPIRSDQSAEGGPQCGHPLPRTTAEKRAAVLSMLDAHPELSDREIGRRRGVSPQTVNTWRKKRDNGPK